MFACILRQWQENAGKRCKQEDNLDKIIFKDLRFFTLCCAFMGMQLNSFYFFGRVFKKNYNCLVNLAKCETIQRSLLNQLLKAQTHWRFSCHCLYISIRLYINFVSQHQNDSTKYNFFPLCKPNILHKSLIYCHRWARYFKKVAERALNAKKKF